MELAHLIDVAAGRRPADRVLRGVDVVNVFSGAIERTDVAIAGGCVAGLGDYEAREAVDLRGCVVIPGLIDAHVHVESSMLSVREFARAVAARGTTAVVVDPHELANVLGAEGIRHVLREADRCPIDVHVMLSSCVPASPFESAGARLDAQDLRPLLSEPRVLGLAEMMDFPAVVGAEPAVLEKLHLAGDRPVDGHAPGVSGRALAAYAAAGIGSDHECTTLDEAREKLRLGLMVMIREGSQARDLDALLPLVTPANAHRFCFCTDDRHADDLLEEGHVDHVLRRAVAADLDPVLAVRLASFNAARHYGLRRCGAVAPGYVANLAVVEDLKGFRVRQVYHAGRLVAADGRFLADAGGPGVDAAPIGTVRLGALEAARLEVPLPAAARVHVIEVREGSLVTGRSVEPAPVVAAPHPPRHAERPFLLAADPQRDLAKVAVFERHRASGNIGVGLVRGFGLRRGALASTVAHDAHNLVVVGIEDADMLAAARHIAHVGGGLCVVGEGRVVADLPLPIAGLMSDRPADEVARRLRDVRGAAHGLGVRLRRPFMALSFLTLSVIGRLKITDQGLIDVEASRRIDLIARD